MRRIPLLAALLAPLSAHASLSCGSPCTSGTLSQAGSFYDVFVDCSSGAYTAATGAAHPATLSSGSTQNVIFGGASGSPGTSSLGMYLYSTNEHFSSDTEIGAITVAPLGACAFDPADSAQEVANLGIETEWLVTDAGGNQYVWRHEVVTFGDGATNAGVRLTQAVSASAAPAITEIGLRWQIDYESASDDGPTFATVVCDPFLTSTPLTVETELDPALLADFYRMINNTGTPLVENYASTTPLGGFPGTGKPDRLVYGSWGNLVGAEWAYLSTPTNADFDSAVLYYFGATQPNALTLAANASVSRSVVLFNGVDSEDCGEFEPKDTGDTGDTADTDTQEPIDTEDSDPVDPIGSHYAGGCASCDSGGRPASGLWLFALALPLLRRRGGRA